MRAYLAFEFKRAFMSAGMIVALVMGCGLAIHHFVSSVLPSDAMGAFADEAARHGAMNFLPDYLWGAWMMADGRTFHGYVFIMMLPLLVSLPHAGTLLQDRKYNFTHTALVIVSRFQYLASKWLATFFSGGVVAATPALFNFLLCMTVYPVITPVAGSGHSVVDVYKMFAELYMGHPVLWVVVWMVIIFIAGGCFAVLALAVTFMTEHAFVIHALPFLCIFVASTALVAFGFDAMSPLILIDPLRNMGGFPILLFWFALFAGISVAPCIWALSGDTYGRL